MIITMRMKSIATAVSLVALLGSSCLTAPAFAADAKNNTKFSESTYKYLELFGDVFERVRKDYVEEVSDQDLLENAIKYSPNGGEIVMHVSRADGEAQIAISDRGIGIPREAIPHLFEPFFTTASTGTGLGLYICRELCERHGAHIDYRQHPFGIRHCNEFFMTMSVESATASHAQP